MKYTEKQQHSNYARPLALAAVLVIAVLSQLPVRVGALEPEFSAGASATDIEDLPKPEPEPTSQPTAASRPEAEQELNVSRVLVADIDGTIDPGSRDHFVDTIADAERRGFGMVVFRLDTPGGLLDSTRDIVKAFMSARVPVAVLVAPSGARAASAGAFITMAAHVAAMAPGTNIGAAHPVTVGGGGGGGGEQDENAKHLARKAEEDTAAFIEGIAEQRHRNKEWARKAVVKSVSVVSSKAKELGVIDLIARDVTELLEKADGLSVEIDGEWKTLRCQGAQTEHREMSFSSRIVHTFSNPNVSYLLFMAGILGIAMELYHPGVIFPGVLGAISLILAFISFQIVPVNVGGVLLILVGSVMLVAEAFMPSFGALGIGGAVGVVIGGLILVDDVDPNLWAAKDYGVSPWAMWPTVIVMVGLIALIGVAVMRSRQRPPVTGGGGMVGQRGRALTAVTLEGGKVQVGPETWAASADRPVAAQTAVRIVAVDGLHLKVSPIDGGPERPPEDA